MHDGIRFGAPRRGSSRTFMIIAACLALLAAGCDDKPKSEQQAEKAESGVFDSSKLPRVKGAKQIYAGAETTIFVSPDPIGPTASALDKALAAAGWQKYVAPHTAYRESATMRTIMLKKGSHALNVFITVAPAQNNAITVQYSALPLKTDLPFTKDASNIEYSPDRPLLTLVTAEPADKILDFYRKEMAERGWFLWSEKTNGKQAPGGPSGTIHEGGGYAHYISDKDPSVTLVLTLQKTDNGKSKLEIKQWPVGVLQTAHRGYLNRDNSAPLVIVSKLPRLPGAKETDRSTAERTVYSVAGNLPATSAAIKALLAADGWKFYVAPLDSRHSTWLQFKKGAQGLSVHFTILPGTNEQTTSQTTINYVATRLQFALPVPEDATDIVFDERRPYLALNAGGTIDSIRNFYNKQLAAAEWSPLSAADAAKIWPNAKFAEKPANGDSAYYVRGENRAIMLTLRARDGGKVSAEIKVPPFAQAQTVEADRDIFGLPIPKPHKTAGGTGGKVRREVHADVPASVDAVLAFYRRTLAARGWTEETQGAVNTADDVTFKFTTPDGTATLKLGHRYDLTTVSLVRDVTKQAPKADTPAAGNSIDAMLQQAQRMIRDAKKDAAAATKSQQAQQVPTAPNGAIETLRPLAGGNASIPLPETAQDIDAGSGSLEFTSASSVKSVAEFYRATMKQQGWRSQASVINNATMVVLNFSKAGKAVSLTIMRMGPKTNVSASGSALRVATAKPADASASQPATADDLIAEVSGGLPVPKRHTMTAGTKTPFRREVNANVPLDLAAVLGFYRRELGKLNWKEDTKTASVAADRAALAFASPEGPALLTLGRKDNETTVSLVVKNPQAAKKAGILPKSGQAKVVFGNTLPKTTALTFNNRTIKIAAGAGAKAPNGPAIDIKPGKYKYSIKLPGEKAQTDEVEVRADEIWGLIIGPGGILALQAY